MRSHVPKYISAAGFLCAALIGSTAGAANLTVNSLADVDAAGDGECTLREAISNADGDTDITGGDCAAGAGADSITFSLSGTIVLGDYLPEITDSAGLTLNGGGQSITVSGNNAYQILSVEPEARLDLKNLSLINGFRYYGSGGAIENEGAVTISNCTFSGNKAREGGAIFNYDGTVTVTDSRFSDNSATAIGGAIANYGGFTVIRSDFSSNHLTGYGGTGGAIASQGSLTVTHSSFSGNSVGAGASGGAIAHENGTFDSAHSSFSDNSADYGGAISIGGDGFTITDSTFSGNSAVWEGGAIENDDVGSITNSTFSGNSAPEGGAVLNDGVLTLSHGTFAGNSASSGGAIFNDHYGSLNLSNTLLADSSAGGDCVNAGGFNPSGINLVEDGSCDPNAMTGDPNLGPLADNGGPTQTHALLEGSIAIDAADNAACSATDQRGVSRPADGNNDGDAVCDIGAYELAPPVDACTTAGVLDNFDRADGPLGPNWGGSSNSLFYHIIGQRVDVQLGGPAHWNSALFGVNQAVFVRLSGVDRYSSSQGALLKVQPDGAPEGGAIAVLYDGAAQAVRVSTLRQSKLFWQSYGNTPVVYADGDKLGGCALSNGEVRVYKNDALVATVMLDAADQAFFNAKGGKLGLRSVLAPSAFFDDFGGGTVTP